MTEKYVVEVAAPLPGESDAAAAQLARILKLDLARVASLINRLPDVVTRPVSHREATVVVERFTQAGLKAHLRPAQLAAEGFSAVLPAAEPARTPHAGTHFTETDLDAGSGRGSSFGAADELILVTDAPAQQPASAQPGDISPADLQARLQRAAQGSSQAAFSDSGAQSTPQSTPGSAASTSAVADTPRPATVATPSPTIVAAAPSTPGEVAAQQAARTRKNGKRRRGSLQAKLIYLAVIPVLLTIVGALAATWYTARPALYQQLLDSARNPAIATAASLSSAFEQVATDGAIAAGGIDYLQLQSTILITRQAFPREDIAFIIATDTNGDPLPGFFAGAQSLTTGTIELQTAIRDRAIAAIAAGPSARAGGRQDQTSQLLTSGNTSVEIVAQPLIVNNAAVGAIVVGVTDLAVTQQVNRILVNVLLFSLLPLLLAILIAIMRARKLTGSVLSLTEKADQISRGNLDERIEVRSNDELDDLSEALERMRVSMKGALERLRRRR